jgi:hypothetical protein
MFCLFQILGRDFQVGNEAHGLEAPRLVVRGTKNGRRVYGGQRFGREWRVHQNPALLRDTERPAEQRLSGSRAEADDQLRLHEADLGLEPWQARGYLLRVRFGVDTPLAARLPFEVLHDIGYVSQATVDLSLLERLVEEFAGRPDERLSREVFVVAGLFSDEDNLRLLLAVAEHGLRAPLP